MAKMPDTPGSFVPQKRDSVTRGYLPQVLRTLAALPKAVWTLAGFHNVRTLADLPKAVWTLMGFPKVRTLAVFMLPLTTGAQAPVWPVPGEVPELPGEYAAIVQPTASGQAESALFGCVRNNGNRFHEAVDIAPVLERKRGEATDPVVAIHDGIVRHISTVAGNSSYGRYVVLEHPGLDLQIYSLYSHLAKVEPGLKVGQNLQAGQVLGIMGRSAGGYSIPRERAHLHLEIGLRLSGTFETWYQRQAYRTPNQHGNFNGMNLIGFDPLAYFGAFQKGGVESPHGFDEALPPAVMLHLYTTRRPDFLDRYPELLLPGAGPDKQAGWEVILSAWGMPLSIKPLRADELKGVDAPGAISVVGINRASLDAYGCRDIIDEKRGKVTLGRIGQNIIEILFMP